MARAAEQVKVRELWRTLYRAARPSPGDGSTRSTTRSIGGDVLGRAWELVRANRGAAGIDLGVSVTNVLLTDVTTCSRSATSTRDASDERAAPCARARRLQVGERGQ